MEQRRALHQRHCGLRGGPRALHRNSPAPQHSTCPIVLITADSQRTGSLQQFMVNAAAKEVANPGSAVDGVHLEATELYNMAKADMWRATMLGGVQLNALGQVTKITDVASERAAAPAAAHSGACAVCGGGGGGVCVSMKSPDDSPV